MNDTAEMDAEIQAIDIKIAKKQVVIQGLEDCANKILSRIERRRQELRKLGEQRAEKSTFKLL